MDVRCGWRWEQLLLIAFLVFGVLSMHSAVVTQPQPGAQPHMITQSDGMAQSPGMRLPAVFPSPADPMPTGGHPINGSEPGLHHLLAACLAVLCVTVLLVAAAQLGLRWQPTRDVASGRRPSSTAAGARPPPTTALRLAELCVLRR